MSPLLDITTSHPLLAIGGLLTFWYLVSTGVAWYRLRHIPGPLLASISDLWMIRASTSTRLSDIFAEVGEKYGPFVRVGPNQVLTSDSELLRRTGAVRSPYERHDWYVAFRWQPYVDNTFTLRGRVAHDKRKAQVATAYNITGRGDVDLIEPSVDEQVVALVDLLRRKYVGRPPKASDTKTETDTNAPSSPSPPSPSPLLDFGELSSYITMDVITKAAFGEEFGHLRTDSDITGFLTHLRDAWPSVALVTEFPLLRTIMYSRWYLNLFGPKVTDKTGMGRIMSGVVQLVQDRFQGKHDSKPRNDMLASWIHHGITQEECEAEGLLALVAGSETTASVMRITFLCILSSPPVYHKLQSVIEQAVNDGTVSEPISFSEAKDIPYLRAVIYEGMRMRPGAVGTLPKIVPPQGETVRGVFLPGGTLIGSNTPYILRDPDVFGPDAKLFRPERWLEVGDAQRTEMEREVEMIFGSGRWMCAGKPIAFMELFKTFFELLRNFDFYIANPRKPWDSRCYTVYVEENMWVRVTEKQKLGTSA